MKIELPADVPDLQRRMREMWRQGHLCDVTLQSCRGRGFSYIFLSCDGQRYPCHRIFLSAFSDGLKLLLGEAFREGQQIQQGEAWHHHRYMMVLWITCLLQLSSTAEELRASLDASIALQLLQQIYTLGHTDLRKACEDKIARNFESCVAMIGFTKLSAPQLARILVRNDLWVTREEIVLQGLFTWIKAGSDRKTHFGTLLQNIDFRSLSAENLKRLVVFAQSMGQDGFELQSSADEALKLKRDHRPYRRCFRDWSPALGSFSSWYSWGIWVAGDCLERATQSWHPSFRTMNFCWHQGHFYIHDDQGLTRWKLAATEGHCLVATGGTVGSIGRVAISAQGDVYLLHSRNDGSRPKAELRVYDSDETLEQDQPKTVVNTDDLDTDDRGFGIYDCSCSPDGVLYVLCNESSGEVKRLSGSNLVPVPVNFPPKFIPDAIVACRRFDHLGHP
eukprot:s4528_g6.t1